MENTTLGGRESGRCRTALLVPLGVALIAMAGAAPARSQEQDSHALWRVYFSAAAAAAAERADNWPEAEALFAAAADQAQQQQPTEPYLTFAKYSLAATYYEEDRAAEAGKILGSLQFALDPAVVRPDLQPSVDTLTDLGKLFYNQAETRSDDPKLKDLKGDARQKVDDDINQKYQYARRFYQWAYVIEEKLLPPDSPELAGPAEWAGLMNFQVGDYAAAIDNLTQLMHIQQVTAQREKTLSSGSLAYSLDSRQEPGKASNPKAAPAAVSLYIGLSYEQVASGLTSNKPEQAAQNLAEAEHYMEKYVDDAEYGDSVRLVLLRVYGTHQQLLLRLHDPAAAAALAKKAKPLQARQAKPS